MGFALEEEEDEVDDVETTRVEARSGVTVAAVERTLAVFCSI